MMSPHTVWLRLLLPCKQLGVKSRMSRSRNCINCYSLSINRLTHSQALMTKVSFCHSLFLSFFCSWDPKFPAAVAATLDHYIFTDGIEIHGGTHDGGVE